MTKDMRLKCKALEDAIAQHRIAHATYEELAILITAHETGAYAPAHQTKLYSEHSGEYCEVLTLLDRGFMITPDGYVIAE